MGGNSALLTNNSSHCLITALFIQLKSDKFGPGIQNRKMLRLFMVEFKERGVESKCNIFLSILQFCCIR